MINIKKYWNLRRNVKGMSLNIRKEIMNIMRIKINVKGTNFRKKIKILMINMRN